MQDQRCAAVGLLTMVDPNATNGSHRRQELNVPIKARAGSKMDPLCTSLVPDFDHHTFCCPKGSFTILVLLPALCYSHSRCIGYSCCLWLERDTIMHHACDYLRKHGFSTIFSVTIKMCKSISVIYTSLQTSIGQATQSLDDHMVMPCKLHLVASNNLPIYEALRA